MADRRRAFEICRVLIRVSVVDTSLYYCVRPVNQLALCAASRELVGFVVFRHCALTSLMRQ